MNKFRIYGDENLDEIILKINNCLSNFNITIEYYKGEDGDGDGYETYEIKNI